MLNRASLAIILLGTLFLSACASRPDNHLGKLPEHRYDSIEQTLELAQRRRGEDAINLYLHAVELAWQRGDELQARTLLDSVNLDEASPAQLIFAYTLGAELALIRNQPEQAIQLLAKPEFERLAELPLEQQIRSQLARAKALEATERPLAAARERIFTAAYLTGTAAIDNNEQIWRLISQLPSNHYQVQQETDLDGWIALASLYKSNSSLAQKQLDIQQWLQTNPEHPAAQQLPAALQALQKLQVQPLKRIAVFLPSADSNQNVVDAIRYGFLSAHFQARDAGKQVPELFFYNSSEAGSMSTLYQQLQQNQIDLLVGPWEKNLVTSLTRQQNLPVTTLALNYAENQQEPGPPNLFQYGLAAEDEARLVARKAWADGKRNALVLVQPGSWGQRVQKAFADQWAQLGGNITAAKSIGQPVELAQQLGEMLLLRDSEQRGRKLQALLGTQLHAQPTRRTDVDFVFIAAGPQQARQIPPTLKFQYAGDLPIYATSSINPGQNNSSTHDLDGIQLTEIPWLLHKDSPLRQEIVAQWPEADQFMGRFYAMGADAYQLALQLQQLQALPGSHIEGFTGTMQLNQLQQVERTLYWAVLQQGQAIPVLHND